jgi:hypothetical protein
MKYIDFYFSLFRHPGEGRDPANKTRARQSWIPAFAGMTVSGVASKRKTGVV